MNASLAVPVFIFALVPTGLLSFLFVWLLRDIVKPRLARALVANSLSLLTLTVASGFALVNNGEPDFQEALMGFFVPQGIWTLFAALPAVSRHSTSQLPLAKRHAPVKTTAS
jgi:hypothetical protein